MALFHFVFILFILEQYAAQVVDIGGVWEMKCPQGCSCQILKFADLSLHQWLDKKTQNQALDDADTKDPDFIFNNELLNVATCVVSENPGELLAKLPPDIQVFTILESGNGESDIVLRSSDLQRFPELISLEIQGMERDNTTKKAKSQKKGGIILSADTLLPLGMTLLYLNLERVTLSSLSLTNRNKANLVVKPAITSHEDSTTRLASTNSSNLAGHRLIFLSQQVGDNNDDKEILPYDVYKQEVEGRTESGGLFTGLGALTHLRVYDCALKDISWHMFDGLDNLLYLSLEKNDLKVIPEFSFYGTPNLKKLSLAENQLLTLNSVDLAGLLMLENLDLSGNNLTFLSELSFPPFPALQVADFQENPLDSIFPSTFEIMNRTLRLYIGGEGTNLKLQKNSLLGLQELKVIHLFNLEIPILERFILQGMPALRELKMWGNISIIEFDAFIDLSNLVDLDLSHCHIRKISMDAFYGLESVNRIDLSYNDLEHIPPGLFSLQQQKSLREIILSKNRLTSLPNDFFKGLRNLNKQPRIQNLRLDGNPWDCSCAMENWNPQLVNRTREMTPRCFTPKSVQNWAVFHALRKGGLQCKRFKRRNNRKSPKVPGIEENNIS